MLYGKKGDHQPLFDDIKPRSDAKSCVFRLNEYECLYTNEKWLITFDVFSSSLGKRPKINIMKSKLENKEPLFHDKMHLQCKNGSF